MCGQAVPLGLLKITRVNKLMQKEKMVIKDRRVTLNGL